MVHRNIPFSIWYCTIPEKYRNSGTVYHSSFVDEEGIMKACGCPLLPLKTHIKGPAPVSDQDKIDIVDEAITFFRANVFFKNFDIKSPADKLLIYLTFYINVALKRLEGCRTLAVGTKAIINLGLEKVPVPGEPGFPFPGLFSVPRSQDEAELFRNYLKQIREETSGRLLNCAYRPNGTPNKWWLAFAKRKFMNIDYRDVALYFSTKVNNSLHAQFMRRNLQYIAV
ncbi:actin-related protein 2 3 complex subunit 3 [Musa troglodytarum]|uniref:Actin-related protein 2 3 complex subunit 3 n=1 Tax=Musa troglodytarum TaxID=320322 RepID=A0A9E7FI20_9LILI|nr:actin-related protein 2 3 complex subunit 3 [Musa troglodytarum]